MSLHHLPEYTAKPCINTYPHPNEGEHTHTHTHTHTRPRVSIPYLSRNTQPGKIRQVARTTAASHSGAFHAHLNTYRVSIFRERQPEVLAVPWGVPGDADEVEISREHRPRTRHRGPSAFNRLSGISEVPDWQLAESGQSQFEPSVSLEFRQPSHRHPPPWALHQPPHRSHLFHSCTPGHTAVTGSLLGCQADQTSPLSNLFRDCPSKADKIPDSLWESWKPPTSFPPNLQLCLHLPLSHFLLPGLVLTIPRIYLPPQGLCTCCFLCQNSLPADLPMPGSSSAFGSQSQCSSSGVLRALLDLKESWPWAPFFSHSPSWHLPLSEVTLFRYSLIWSLSSP